ncbi:MAG: phage tail family protein [Chloroflexi bacterium]|nr:phage tail family protein [Chloroflexota bacterium]
MSYWQVLIPEASQNMVKNPSAETTFNYQPRNGAIIVRSTDYAWKGLYSFRVYATANDEGLHFTLSALVNDAHYVSMRGRGTFGGTWQWSLDNANWTAPTALSTSDGWTYYGASFEAAQANGSTKLYVRQSGAGASLYYLDAIMVEHKGYYTTYVDGDQEGCTWDGANGTPPADFQDTFTRADSATLGTATTGQTWTETTYAISGNTAVNTPALGAELGTNMDMEALGTWLDVGTPTSQGRDATQVHGGAWAWQVVAAADGDGIQQAIAMTAGNWYKASAWFYNAATINQRWGVEDNFDVYEQTTAATWTNFTRTFRCTSGGNNNFRLRGAAAYTFWTDDASLKLITTADLFAKLTSYAVDGVAECAMTIAANRQAGMVLRYQDDNDYLLCYVDRTDGNCYFIQNVAGTISNIFAAAAVTYAAGKRLWVDLNGTTGTVYYGGALVGTGTIPASTYKVHGLFSTDSGNSFSSFMFMHGQDGSTSTRSSQSRAGGRWRDFYDDYSVGVVGMVGFGIPDVQHNVTPYSILPGALLQNIKTKTRDFALIMEPQGGSLTSLHTARDHVIDAVKPDLVSPVQPVRLKYTGSTNEVVIQAHYAGGLEGNFDGTQGVQERFGVKFMSYDPYFEAIKDGAATLTTKLSVANADRVIKKISGTWAALSTGLNGEVWAIETAIDGTVYVGGLFTNAGGVAAADYIAKWTPGSTAWSALGTGVTDSTGAGAQGVQAIAIAPDGAVYVGGTLTSAGGIANTSNIAKYTPGSDSWSAVSTGLDNAVQALGFAQNGDLWIGGGAFGGVVNNYVTKYNGTSFATLSTMATSVYGLTVDSNDDLYIAGLAGAAADRIMKWNGSTWGALGSGASGTCYKLAIGPDGYLYVAAGTATVGGVTNAVGIAKWNGTAWTALSTGVGGGAAYTVRFIDGLLHVGGAFTQAGGITLADRYAIWNGSAWLHADVDLPGSASVWAIASPNDKDVYLGYDTAGTASGSALTTITNSGSTVAYPKLIIKRTGGTSGTLEYLKNETTGKTIWFNYALLDGETLTIDFTPGNKTMTSSIFGNVIGRALLPGSDFSTWALQPGSNSVSLFVADAGTPSIVATMEWIDLYWSPDGAVS